MSYSNPMHHANDARAPIRRASQNPAAPTTGADWERDQLLQLIGRIHNNAAESPEWIRARIDETIVRIAESRTKTR